MFYRDVIDNFYLLGYLNCIENSDTRVVAYVKNIIHPICSTAAQTIRLSPHSFHRIHRATYRAFLDEQVRRRRLRGRPE